MSIQVSMLKKELSIQWNATLRSHCALVLCHIQSYDISGNLVVYVEKRGFDYGLHMLNCFLWFLYKHVNKQPYFMCSSVLCLFFNKKIGFLLQKASKLIVKRSSPMDGQLFLIKHLLILREQVISPLSLSLYFSWWLFYYWSDY